jgi:voltage-gated sodium channel
LRALRLLRFMRLMRFIPNPGRMLNGAKRALRASVGILLVLLLYNFIFALAGHQIFGPAGLALPEFADPLTSMYTMFKIFTIEGWYDICDQLSPSLAPIEAHFVRIYFIAAVVTGGLLILGLLNAVFVDEMSNDLARQTEEEVNEVARGISELHSDFALRLDEISNRLARIEDRGNSIRRD